MNYRRHGRKVLRELLRKAGIFEEMVLQQNDISFLFSNKLPHTYRLKPEHLLSLSIFGQVFRCSVLWVLSSRSHKPSVKMSAGLCSCLEA